MLRGTKLDRRRWLPRGSSAVEVPPAVWDYRAADQSAADGDTLTTIVDSSGQGADGTSAGVVYLAADPLVGGVPSMRIDAGIRPGNTLSGQALFTMAFRLYRGISGVAFDSASPDRFILVPYNSTSTRVFYDGSYKFIAHAAIADFGTYVFRSDGSSVEVFFDGIKIGEDPAFRGVFRDNSMIGAFLNDTTASTHLLVRAACWNSVLSDAQVALIGAPVEGG